MNLIFKVCSLPVIQKMLLAFHPRVHRMLYYHMLSDKSKDSPYYYVRQVLPIGELKRQIEWLRKMGFLPVSIDEFLANRGKYEKELTFSVSTDDGYAESYTEFAPYLEAQKVPCVFFLCNSVIGNERFLPKDRLLYALHKTREPSLRKVASELVGEFRLSPLPENREFLQWSSTWPQDQYDQITQRLWTLAGLPEEREVVGELAPYVTGSQVRDLLSRGFRIGSHTLRHLDLARTSPEVAEREVLESVRDLRDRFATPIDYFSYPFGHRLPLSREREMIGKSGVKLFFSTQNNLKYGKELTCWGRDSMEHRLAKAQTWFCAVPLLRRYVL
jgi:peptidoglycan/xylan/chitin deacetylase (PgdA/CDA1 family)